MKKSSAGKALCSTFNRPCSASSRSRAGSALTMLPDPLTAAWLVDPAIAGRLLATGLRMELGQNAMRGASITQRGSGVKLILDIDKSGFDPYTEPRHQLKIIRRTS